VSETYALICRSQGQKWIFFNYFLAGVCHRSGKI